MQLLVQAVHLDTCISTVATVRGYLVVESSQEAKVTFISGSSISGIVAGPIVQPRFRHVAFSTAGKMQIESPLNHR